MSHNTRTNLFLGTVIQAIEELEKGGKREIVPITVVVSGQIITGNIVSASEYFSHKLTSSWKDIYDLVITTPRKEYFDLPEEEFNVDKIPDTLKQGFLFLGDAFYVNGDKFTPSIGNKGIPIQIRLADIVAFNFGSVSAEKNN